MRTGVTQLKAGWKVKGVRSGWSASLWESVVRYREVARVGKRELLFF